MIATGGLLRINARRQDSLRSRPQKPHTHKKNKKKRRSEVVVVKGKLKLCSISGLVAAVGILVLLMGVVMAALGYWPRDGLFFSSPPQEGTAMASVSSTSSTPAHTVTQGAEKGGVLQRGGGNDTDGGDNRMGGQDGREGDNRVKGDDGWGRDDTDGGHGGGGGDADSFNWTETVSETNQQSPRGFLEDFLDRYLYSDRLKVFGPLIMGIGIFLFICANAVLHENRDKKTKVINLRDIYSTVIDLHSLRRPNSSSSCSAPRSSANPLNGLVNYVQSKSLESKPRVYPTSLMNRKEAGGGEEGGEVLSRQQLRVSSRGGADTVFSIYQEHLEVSPPLCFSSSNRLTLPPSFSPPHLSTCWASLQREKLSSLTLPTRRSHPSAPRRSHSARARTCQDWGQGRRGEGQGGSSSTQEDACPPPRPFEEASSAAPCSSSSLQREASGGSHALLLLSTSSLSHSHLSLSSLSHLLSSSPTTVPPCRRQSLPTNSIITRYSKLMHREDESYESTKITSLHHVTSQASTSRSEEVTSQRK